MFSRVDTPPIAFAEQDDLIADFDARGAGDVHGRQVHGDPARYRRVLIANDYAPTIREQTMEAIGVADW